MTVIHNSGVRFLNLPARLEKKPENSQQGSGKALARGFAARLPRSTKAIWVCTDKKRRGSSKIPLVDWYKNTKNMPVNVVPEIFVT